MSWVSDLLGITNVFSNGSLAPPQRDSINFIAGSGMTITASDNPVTLRTDVTFSTSVGVGAGSATTNVLQWSGTSWVATSTPTVTSLTANSFLAAGSPLPTVGGLRLANGVGTGVASRTTGGVDVGLIYIDGADNIFVGDVSPASVTIENDNVIMRRFLRFKVNASGPKISQDTQTSDAATQNLTIVPQAPFATATGANRTPGSLIVNVGAPTNGGTTEAGLVVQRATVFNAQIGPAVGDAATYSAIYLSPALVPSTTNHCLKVSSTLTRFNAGATLSFDIGNNQKLLLNSNDCTYIISTMAFFEGQGPVFIKQTVRGSDAATSNLTVSAQDAFATATGSNRNGGNLELHGGVKATGGVDGKVQFYSGSIFLADVRTAGTAGGIMFSNALTGGAFIAPADPGSDIAPEVMNISSANAFASATTNINGAAVQITPGARKSGSAGLSGPLQVQLNFTETMIEAAEVASGRRVVVLNRMSNITTTELPANTGDGVVYLSNVVTAPTASPVSGGIAWSDTGALRWREPNGAVTQPVYRAGSTSGTTKLVDRRAAFVQTTNATVTTIFSYTISDNTVVVFHAHVAARNQTTAEQGGYFIRHAARRRSAGAAALIGTLVKDAFEEQAAWDVTTTTATNDFVIQVTGAAAQTIDWYAWVDIYSWTP